MARVGRITTPAGTTVELGLKVAVAVGSARRFVVGDPQIQLIDVLAGAPDRRPGRGGAPRRAGRDRARRVGRCRARRSRRSRRAAPRPRVRPRLRRRSTVSAPTCRPSRSSSRRASTRASSVRGFCPRSTSACAPAAGSCSPSCAPRIPLFLRFAGIDFDDDPDAIEALDELVRSAQRIMSGYGGNLLQLTLGDKGAYLYGVFGSPVAHEDDAARAAAAALELRDLVRTTRARDIQIGLDPRSPAQRDVRPRDAADVRLPRRLGEPRRAADGEGADGSHLRRRPGAQRRRRRVHLGAASRPRGQGQEGRDRRASRSTARSSAPRAARPATSSSSSAAGRSSANWRRRSTARSAGDGRIVGIAAEAGMGKSRLIAEFVRIARRRGLFVALGECQSFGTNASYFVWREIWRRLLRHRRGRCPRRASAHGWSRRWKPRPVPFFARAPLLAAVVGLELPDTELTASFDAKLRKSSLEDLLSTLLRARARPRADRHRPRGLPLDRRAVARSARGRSARVDGRAAGALRPRLSARRRAGRRPRYRAASPTSRRCVLDGLDAGRRRGARPLEAGAGARASTRPEVGDALVALVHDAIRGQPVLRRGAVTYLARRASTSPTRLRCGRSSCRRASTASSCRRIDADGRGAAPEPQGGGASSGAFSRRRRCAGAYPDLGELPRSSRTSTCCGPRTSSALDRRAEQAYLFKHVATQEVAYASLPFAIRRSAPRPHRPRTSSRSTPMASSTASTSWPTTSGTATTRSASVRTSSVPPMPPGRLRERGRGRLPHPARSAAHRRATGSRSLLKLGQGAGVLRRLADSRGDRHRGAGPGHRARRRGVHAAGPRSASPSRPGKQGRYDEAADAPRLRPRERFDAVGLRRGHRAGPAPGRAPSRPSAATTPTARERTRESLAIRERLGDTASLGGLYSNLGDRGRVRGRHRDRARSTTSARSPFDARSATDGRSASARTTSA